MNQRYVLTYVLLPITQRECDTFCCGHTDCFNPIQDGGGEKSPPRPTSFYPVTSTNVGIGP